MGVLAGLGLGQPGKEQRCAGPPARRATRAGKTAGGRGKMLSAWSSALGRRADIRKRLRLCGGHVTGPCHSRNCHRPQGIRVRRASPGPPRSHSVIVLQFQCAASRKIEGVSRMTSSSEGIELAVSRRRLLAAAGIVGAAVCCIVRERRRGASRGGDPTCGRSGDDATRRRSAPAVRCRRLVPGRRLLAHAPAGAPTPASCSARWTAGSSRTVDAEIGSRTRMRKADKSSTRTTRRSLGCSRIRPISMPPCTTASSRSSAPSGRHRRDGPASCSPASATRERRPLGKKYVPPAGVSLANPPYVNDNLGSPAAGGHHPRRRAAAALVPSLQRRPLLCQPGRGPRAHVVGFLGEQQPQCPPVTARGCPSPRQPRERTRQRTDRATRPTRPTSPCPKRRARPT